MIYINYVIILYFMENILEIKDLHKSYGDIKAVDGLSLQIEEGSCFGLLGPNGAGKTTTIEMMEGIINSDKGEILFKGNPIDRSFKKKVGIQFQTTALPEFITVKETIELFSSFYPNPRPLDELIELCSLSDILSQDNRKLSGGQRQRMLLGLAIVAKPEIVFLDEPTTGLDPQARRNFWDLIRGIQKENCTVLLTTHYMDEAEILCDKIAIMDHGKVLECDTPDGLLNNHFKGVLIRVPHSGKIPTGVDNLVEKDSVFEIQTSELEKSMKQLMSTGIDLSGLSIHKPNLEDLFIKMTGSTLRA